MIVGYARVSSDDQDLSAQEAELRAAGVDVLYSERVSGQLHRRPQLDACLASLNAGDTLAVVALDRLGRSLSHLVLVVDELGKRGVQLRSLTEGFDTGTAGGELVFHVMGAVAQWERRIISERTKFALDMMREQGRTGGRPRVMTPEKLEVARRLRDEGKNLTQIAKVLGVSWASVQRYLAADFDINMLAAG